MHVLVTKYSNSFLPSSIREWNNLPSVDRNANTVDAFKRHLNQGRVNVPKYFYTGSKHLQILHTRLRTGCSSLNLDRYSKNIIDLPLCSCRCGDVKNPEHFFFRCHLCRVHRLELRVILFCSKCNVTQRGRVSLSDEFNAYIFEAVYRYIENSKIFYVSHESVMFSTYLFITVSS